MNTPKKETKPDLVTLILYGLPLIGMILALLVYFIRRDPLPPTPTLTPSPIIIIQTRIVVLTSTPFPTASETQMTPVGVTATFDQLLLSATINPSQNLSETTTPLSTSNP